MTSRNRIGTIAVVAVLFAILAAALWYAAQAFTGWRVRRCRPSAISPWGSAFSFR